MNNKDKKNLFQLIKDLPTADINNSDLKELVLQFIVEEIPSIGDVEINGNAKVDTNDIREKIGLRRGATFNEHLIQESKEEILKFYMPAASIKISWHFSPIFSIVKSTFLHSVLS